MENKDKTLGNKEPKALVIYRVSKSFNCECAEPLELQYDVGLTIFCEKCGKNVKQ